MREQDFKAMGRWRQAIDVNGTKTPGKWDVREQADFLIEQAPWPIEGRILDCGANAGGLSIALQDRADELVAVEISYEYSQQFAFLSRQIDTSKVKYVNDSLFIAHTLGRFDVALMLGLFYHMRHPMLFLDYVSNIDAKRFVFSTQVADATRPVLVNRLIHKVFKGEVRGWQPERGIFAKMLGSVGFKVDRAVDAPAHFGNRHYVFCTRKEAVQTDVDAIARLSKFDGFWC